LTLAMVVIAPSLTLMKTCIYCSKNVTTNLTLELFLGVWPNEWTKTFLNDIVIFVLAVFLFWHYCTQKDDTNKRLIHQGT